jgi:hypothetical protein
MRTTSLVLLACFSAVPVVGQERVRLEERLEPGSNYHVSSRTQIVGSLKLPDKTIDVVGASVIEYDERVLNVTPQGEVDKTLRLFAKIDFERKVGGEPQRSTIRPQVRRMVVMRQNNIEVPFSPDGPLMLGEIDLVRTDVFTPALVGLLPRGEVRIGDTWKAAEAAVRELTDLEKITGGELVCRLDKLDDAGGQPTAKIAFQGAIAGIGENGPTRHELEGFLHFDRQARRIAYLSLKGNEILHDAMGQPQGKVTGTFVLTRTAEPLPREIADLRGIDVNPNDTNTQLLFDDEESGLRFLHSRRWKSRVEGNTVKLDDHRGNGLLITIESLQRLPTALQFQKETRTWIESRKGTVHLASAIGTAQRFPTQVESFAFDADLREEKGSRRVLLYHAVVHDTRAGATVSATLTTQDRAVVQREIERIVAGIRFGR